MIIETRDLTLKTLAGDVVVPIRIFMPEEVGGHWRCRSEIGWPDAPYTSVTWGFDAMQALVLTLHGIGTTLYYSSHHEAAELCWGTRGGGYGFPVLPSVRSLLIGDDLKFL